MKNEKRAACVAAEVLAVLASITVLFLFICFAKKIEPFGENLLVGGDFAEQNIPYYYHIWDVLHGRASLFFEWREGLGQNYAGIYSHFCLLNPVSLFFLFVRERDRICHVMIWFSLLRLLLAGLTFYIFLKRDQYFVRGKLSLLWTVLLCLAYALSGYSLQYYEFDWQDLGIFLPLAVLFLNRLFDNRRKVLPNAFGYCAALGIMIVSNLPQAYAVCLFLFFYAGGVLLIVYSGDRQAQRRGALVFFYHSLLTAGLFAFLVYPAASAIGRSGRASMNGYLPVIGTFMHCMTYPLGAFEQFYFVKYLIVAGSALPILLIVTGLVTGKGSWNGTREKKERLFGIYLVLICLAPVVFERINLLWHNGLYVCNPMRYGFVVPFAFAALAAYFLTGTRTAEIFAGKRAAGVLGIVLETAVILWIGITQCPQGLPYTASETDGSVRAYWEAEEGGSIFSRVKALDRQYMGNFALVMDVPSYENYNPLNTWEGLEVNQGLGYEQRWVRVGDRGGTVFSDALLGMNYTIGLPESERAGFEEMHAALPLSSEVSVLADGMVLSRNLYRYPVGIFVPGEGMGMLPVRNEGNPFAYQNEAFAKLFGTDRELIATETIPEEEIPGKVIRTIRVEGEKALYLYLNAKNAACTVSVNGTPLDYSCDLSPYVLFLGTYRDETLDFSMDCSEATTWGDSRIGLLDLPLFIESTENVRSPLENISWGGDRLSFDVKTDEKGWVVLPVQRLEGWSCYVDGAYRDVKAFGVLQALQVAPEDRSVRMVHMPSGYRRGVRLTEAALLIFAAGLLFYCLRSKEPFAGCLLLLEKLAYIGLIAGWALGIGAFYAVPILVTIKDMLAGR